MDLNEILMEIKKRWIAFDNFEAIVGLENAPRHASTGTEGLILISKYITELKSTNNLAYEQIQDLALELFEYEKSKLKR